MAGRRIGEVFVAIEADTSLFRAQAFAGVKKAITGLDAKIPVTADTKEARTQIAALKARMTDLSKQLSEVKIGANGKPAEATIRKLQLQLKELADFTAHITMEADTTKLDAQIARQTANLRKLQQQASNLKLKADDKKLISQIADLELKAEHLDERLGDMDLEIGSASYNAIKAKLASVGADLEVLNARAKRIVMRADAVALKKEIIATTALIDRLKAEAADLKLGGKTDLGALAAAELRLLGLEEAAKRLNPELKATNNALVQGGRNFGRFGLGVLTARVALFGGLTAISGFHIALDVVIESLAVLIPALVTAAAGLLAFGLAGVDAGRAVANRLQNVHTVADAFNATIPPMTGNLEKLHNTVRPQVWQLYGDAISAAGTHNDRFNKLAVTTGGVIDRLAAKLTILVKTSGTGIDKFFASGSRDLQQFSRILSNLGSAFGKLIQISERTGIAEALLSILNAGTKLLNLFTKLPIPLLTAVIAFHGIYIWSGLAATGLTRLLRPLVAIAGTAAGTKAAGKEVEALAAAGASTRFQRFGATTRDLGTNLKAAGSRALGAVKALGGFITTPWGAAIVIGVAALAGLAFILSKVKDSTGEAITAIDKMVNKATVFTVINKLGEGLVKSNQDIAASEAKAAVQANVVGAAIEGAGQKYSDGRSAIAGAATEVERFRAEHAKLIGQLDTVTGHLSQVAQAYGTQGLAGAEALAVAAGVKVSDLLTKDPKKWAVALQMIDGLVRGYNNMGVGTTQLGNALNVLTVAQSDQIKAMTNLNTAYDNFTQIVSGPTTGFLAFANTLKRFSNDAGVAGAKITGLGSGFKTTSKKITDASLQLQSDFQDTFKAANSMADAMRLTGTAANTQIAAIKDVVQVMIPMAGKSKIAAAEISVLAQEAGGPATTNLQTLAKWAGKTKDPLAAAQKAANNAGVSFASMSAQAKKLGATLEGDLTADMAKAVEGAVGLQGAMDKYAKDIQNASTSTSQGHKDFTALKSILDKITGSTSASNAVIKAMTDRITANATTLQKTDQARKNFQADTQKILDKMPGATKDIKNLTDEVNSYHTTSDRGRPARQKLIDDLKKAGVDGDTARRLVDGLRASIAKLHGATVHVNFVGSGSGSIAFKESIPGVTVGPSSSGLLGFHAAGGKISGGTPGKDSVLGMLMPGEVVVPTKMVAAGAVDHLRGRLPGFASGGQVGKFPSGGTFSVSGLSGPNGIVSAGTNYMAKTEAAYGKAVEAAYAKAVMAKFNKDMNALAGGGPAIVSYARSFLGKIPYAFGGTGLSRDDCSGFTQAVYGKFGIHAPRTSEAQFSWATKSGPVPGGLAFYVSPGGGPPPGHVAIVQDKNSVISQGGPQGVKGPAIRPLKFLPLMGTGVPKGGFPNRSGGAGNAAITVAGGPSNANASQAEAYASSRLGAFGWGGAQMKFLIELWNRESGWSRFARNPSSGAYGIPQALPPSKMGAAANPPTSSAAAQINWGLGYIRGRYGSPQTAWGHETSFGWYGQGGMIPGYATGGSTTSGGPAAVTAYRNLLWKERQGEGRDYLGLRAAFAHGPAKYRTKLTVQEINTLAARQGTTQKAFTALTGAGLTKTHLDALGAAARAEVRVASDQWLNRTPGGHPGWAKGLRSWLGQLSATAMKGLPGGQTTSGPGGAGLPAITHSYGGDIANNIGAFISSVAPFLNGGMVSYDKGGWLKPGLTMAYNGTGRNEAVGGTGDVTVTFEVTPSGSAFDAFLISWLKKNVKVKGGGNVQKAWGSH